MTQPKRSNQQNALTLMAGTLGSRISGFLRQSLLTQLFDERITDAFFVALRVPNLFRELLAEGALTNSFIPVYSSLDKQEAKKLSAALLGLLLIANGVLLLLAYFLAPYIVNLLLTSNGSVDKDLAITLTRIVFPFLASISLSAWAMGILNAEEKFLAPAWAPVALNLVAILLMLIFPSSDTVLAWGFVLGGIVQLIVQIPSLIKGKHLSPLTKIWHPHLKNVLILMIPFAFTTSGRQILNVITTNILNLLPQGSVTGFQNADLFLSLALGVFAISPALAYYSRLSNNAKNEPEQFPKTLLEGLQFISFLSAPAGLVLFLLAEPAVQVVFNWFSALGRAGASEATLAATLAATAPLGLAIVPLGLNALLIRTYYVRQKVRTPIALTFIFLSLQGLLYYLLTPTLGIAGLSLATAIVAWLQLITLLALVSHSEKLELGIFLRHFLRVSLATAVAALLCLNLLYALPNNGTWLMSFFRLGLTGISIYVSYFLIAYFLRLSELRQFAKRFLKP